ncbi:MAG: glycosyltransferase family 4 protein [Candidatus Brocadiales bacterium]|nr:glycosyltransferase family 4 protein [Candidatus Bathyanammoxibius sp.]
MPAPLRVCMVTGAYWPQVSGGGKQCKTIVDALGKDVECLVLTTCTVPGLPPVEKTGGATVYRVFVDPSKRGWRLRSLRQFMGQWWRLRRRVTILHLHGISLKTLCLAIFARWVGIPIVQKMSSAGDDDPLALRRKPGGWWKIRVYRLADRFVSVAPALSRAYRTAGLPADRLVEIPNAIDGQQFRPSAYNGERQAVRRNLGLLEERTLILAVGFISYVKGTDLLLEAGEELRRRWGDSVFLLLIGSSDTRHSEVAGDLVRRLQALQSDPATARTLHHVERTLTIEEYYRAADLFVLPSRREGMPNALLEAMASGLPCIASRLPGVTDSLIASGQTGLLVEPEDASALAKAIATVLEMPDRGRSMGRRARASVLERFSVDQVAAQYRNLYHQLAEERRVK